MKRRRCAEGSIVAEPPKAGNRAGDWPEFKTALGETKDATALYKKVLFDDPNNCDAFLAWPKSIWHDRTGTP